MKKILALVLAAVLLLGLTPGALAEDSDLLDYSAWLELWKAENPERVKELLKDEPPLYADYGYATREEMLADWDISQAEYDEMVVYERAWDIYDRDYYEKELENWIGDAREKLGGTRSGLGVMLNGAYITFPDAQPELENGRTMIPLRTLMEAMGAQVSSLDDGTVTCLLNGTTLSFRVGESTVTVERDGKTTSVAMDCASYVKNSRTYVPVRFFAEAVGCDVVVMLVGERPGLGQSESMSCYAVYRPTADTLESDRSVLSNIHREGTPPVEAAAVIVDLVRDMLHWKASGIKLNRRQAGDAGA